MATHTLDFQRQNIYPPSTCGVSVAYVPRMNHPISVIAFVECNSSAEAALCRSKACTYMPTISGFYIDKRSPTLRKCSLRQVATATHRPATLVERDIESTAPMSLRDHKARQIDLHCVTVLPCDDVINALTMPVKVAVNLDHVSSLSTSIGSYFVRKFTPRV